MNSEDLRPDSKKSDPISAEHEAAAQLREAAAAKKCWPCGCLHSSLSTIGQALTPSERSPELEAAMRAAKSRLVEPRYDCLGCEVCYPALAINALAAARGGDIPESEPCPMQNATAREGWPPLAGSYEVLRYRAPVAVCTLMDTALMRRLADGPEPGMSIVGIMQTENLGIERLISNTVANPNIRFLILCGADSRQAIGHLPGQSLAALGRSGLDGQGRIIGARGKRPVVRNIPRPAIEYFRRTVEIVDMIQNEDPVSILEAVRSCASRNPGPAEAFDGSAAVPVIAGFLPEKMTPDSAGYFVVYADRMRQQIFLEHYRNDGVLDCVIAGSIAAELYIPAIERKLISRLDHAAYLGRELARAERALATGEPFIQDAAAERASSSQSCGCASLAVPTKP